MAQLLYYFNWKLPNDMKLVDIDTVESNGSTAIPCIFHLSYNIKKQILISGIDNCLSAIPYSLCHYIKICYYLN